MNANLWTQLLIAIVPALITGVGSLIIAIKKCKNEINTLETNSKHEIEKLMKQHKIDIEALNEKHRLDIETKEKDTFELLNEIRRILTVGGRLIFRVNSVNDVNHGAGQGNEIEHHLYETSDKRLKRFFDEKDIKFFFKGFDIEYLNEEIMTRYKLEKRLYRVCVKKK